MSFPPLSEVVPHDPPMRWIDGIVSFDGDSITCSAQPRAGMLYMDADSAENVIAIEWVAQSVAAFVGMRDKAAGKEPTPGFLIAVPEMVFHIDRFDSGCEVRIEITPIRETLDTGSYAAQVFRGVELAAEGRVSVYRAAEDSWK